MSEKEKKEVICAGRMPSGQKCNSPVYISDGEFIYILDFILNPELESQRILCPNCGYLMHWHRNREFKQSPQVIRKRISEIVRHRFKSKF